MKHSQIHSFRQFERMCCATWSDEEAFFFIFLLCSTGRVPHRIAESHMKMYTFQNNWYTRSYRLEQFNDTEIFATTTECDSVICSWRGYDTTQWLFFSFLLSPIFLGKRHTVDFWFIQTRFLLAMNVLHKPELLFFHLWAVKGRRLLTR